MKKALPSKFFERDTVSVAKALLGKNLLCWHPESQDYVICKITETEAYTQDDPSCHAFKGPKGRGATLFKEPGLAYVYFIYGMYHCLNVVTEPTDRAGAVLFRSLEPVYNPTCLDLNTKGPGRLCRTLGITKTTHNEINLAEENRLLYLTEGESISEDQMITTTRIGISAAQDYPWRFYIKDNPWVSVKAKPSKTAVKTRTR
jgi:DNA-3-methyladenine glycosylase